MAETKNEVETKVETKEDCHPIFFCMGSALLCFAFFMIYVGSDGPTDTYNKNQMKIIDYKIRSGVCNDGDNPCYIGTVILSECQVDCVRSPNEKLVLKFLSDTYPNGSTIDVWTQMKSDYLKCQLNENNIYKFGYASLFFLCTTILCLVVSVVKAKMDGECN